MDLWSRDGGQRAFELLAEAGISNQSSSSAFVEKLFAWLKPPTEQADAARRIASGLERILQRYHEDAHLAVKLCASLQGFTELPAPTFHKKLARTIRYLDKPASQAMIKTLKQAAIAELHPKIIEMTDLDAMAALHQAPRETIRIPETPDSIVMIGDETIHLDRTSPKDIKAAIKKVKVQSERARPEPQLDDESLEDLDEPAHVLQSRPPLADSLSIDHELKLSDEATLTLTNELDEATLALDNLLRSLPRAGALSDLASVIAETRSWLERTRQQVSQAKARADSGHELPMGDMH